MNVPSENPSDFVPKIDLTQSVRVLASTRNEQMDATESPQANPLQAEDLRELRETFKKKFGQDRQPDTESKSKEEKLQLFLKGYKASVAKEQIVIDQNYINAELQKELARMTEETRDVSREFSLAKCQSTTLEILPPLFQQPAEGLCSVYVATEKQGIAFLRNTVDPVPSHDIAVRFGASYLKPPPDEIEPSRMVVSDLEKRVNAAIKGQVLDFEAPETLALFLEIGLIIVFGMKRTVVYTMDRIIAKVEELPKDRASVVALQSALMRAKTSPKRKTAMKYVVDILVSLALDAQLSVFFRFLADAVVFKQKYYYADADIFQYGTCQQIADLIERVEALDFVGYKNFQVANPSVIPKLSNMELRVASTLNEHLSLVRTTLIEGGEIEKVPTRNLIESAKLFLACLIIQENGQPVPMVALWDLFRAIDASKCQHKRFPLYKKLCGKVASKVTLMTDSKALRMVYKLYKHKLAPFVFIFLAHGPPTPFRGFYWRTMNSCLKLANAFKPLVDVVIGVDSEAFISGIRIALAL